MKKISWDRLCFRCAAVLLAAFLSYLFRDAHVYWATLNSSLFWVFMLLRLLEFLLPGGGLFALGLLIQRKRGGGNHGNEF